MASFQISRPGLSPSLGLSSSPPRRLPAGLRCRLKDGSGGGDSSGGEPPESLFMKELKRRGMTPTGGRGRVGEKEMERREEVVKRNGVVEAEYDKGVLDQREQSMALNSEGLEGLIPRGKLLLTLGGTFFLAFWPLIVTTIAIFAAMYFAIHQWVPKLRKHQICMQQAQCLEGFGKYHGYRNRFYRPLAVVALHHTICQYFGSSFVHDGSDIPVSPPPYIDPYALLEDERISKMSPLIK